MTPATPLSAITAWLATQQPAMLSALERMVNTDGGSYDKPGVDAVGDQVREFLHDHRQYRQTEQHRAEHTRQMHAAEHQHAGGDRKDQ